MTTKNNLALRIADDMKQAMREKQQERLATIRLIRAAIKQAEIDQQITADDTAVISIIDKMVKQRLDSISQYEAANRDDLVAKEQQEIEVLKTYLPQPLNDHEINDFINQAIEETGASSMREMGQVMAWLKPHLQGRADMSDVSQRIKARLG